jgi:hypothetical protein
VKGPGVGHGDEPASRGALFRIPDRETNTTRSKMALTSQSQRMLHEANLHAPIAGSRWRGPLPRTDERDALWLASLDYLRFMTLARPPCPQGFNIDGRSGLVKGRWCAVHSVFVPY